MLPERQALSYTTVWRSGLDVALSVLGRQETAKYRAEILDAVILSRALVLDEIALRHRT